MAVYIAADTNFGYLQSRDDAIIENWNRVVKEDDLTILLGDILHPQADKDKAKAVFEKLNGTMKVIDVDSGDESAPYWKEVTHRKCYNINGAVPGIINNEEVIVFIYTKGQKKIIKTPTDYGAAAKSLTKQKKILEDNILSISIDDWGLCPILYSDIPRMIDDILLFDQMEEDNNEKNN